MRLCSEWPRATVVRVLYLLLAAGSADCATTVTAPATTPPSPGVLVQVAALPSPRHESGVFSDGESVYVVGGLENKRIPLVEIVRFDPVEGAVTVLPEALPMPNYGVPSIGAAYLYGGEDPFHAQASDAILRVVP